ncbi:MAG: MBL fold metallo-hydrolase [Planctomycetota bacterium]
MNVTVCGASGGEVTGSGYLVETDRARVLVDFGMFQGRGATDERNRDLGPVDPTRLDAVVVTHAHLDHTGRLPLLARHGLSAPIFATPATVDFTSLVLADAGRIQESDARRENREREREGRPPIEPFYTQDDVEALQPLARPVRYDTLTEIAPGVSIRFVDAGHILGSASVEMHVRDDDADRIIVFSGDIGRWDTPILRDPVLLERADLVFLESTYGDHDHPSFDESETAFTDALRESIWNREKVLIPAFAIGRTQLLLYYIAEQMREERVPSFPIYLDSPMAIKATELYRKHQHLFDEEATELARKRRFQIDLRNLRPLSSSAESRALNDEHDACVIIAGAGMCDGGRIVHHLKHNLWRKHVTFMAVGFMAQGSTGRKIVRGDETIRILGSNIRVRAKVVSLSGFSAHAGQSELLRWLDPLAATSPRVVLTHGEDEARTALAARIADMYGIQCDRPDLGDVITLNS